MYRLLKEKLEERRKMLEELIRSKERSLKKAREGMLRYNKRGNSFYYYLRTEPDDHTGRYIRKKDIKVAEALAQRDYDEMVLRVSREEVKQISRLLDIYESMCAEECADALSEGRRRLIMPINETDEEYAARWSAEEYERMPIDPGMPELYTAKKERVRSKSEVIIADTLNRLGIPYRYECRLFLPGIGSVHPDFTALNVHLRKVLYWEHLGMMDDERYANQAVRKIDGYIKSGYFPGDGLILSFETGMQPLNVAQIERLAERFLL